VCPGFCMVTIPDNYVDVFSIINKQSALLIAVSFTQVGSEHFKNWGNFPSIKGSLRAKSYMKKGFVMYDEMHEYLSFLSLIPFLF
jgi:hypothetical protein